MFRDISQFTNSADYLPILNAALITDIIVLIRVVLGQIKSKSLKKWYHEIGLSGVLADVLSLVIGVVLARFFYSFLFSKFNILLFAAFAVIIQIFHDISFYYFFKNIPRGKSQILDIFKDYANELGAVILVADAAMIVSTVLLASLFTNLSVNANILILIFSSYLVPYLLYSIN